MTEKSNLKVGDVCVTLVEESDIEHIPAGTEIKLIRKSGEDLWHGYATLKGIGRFVLVSADNLKLKTS